MTDKVFWHRYTDFYSSRLENYCIAQGQDILEIGVKDSESIKLWRSFYPDATITGIDLYKRDEWYTDLHVNYIQGNQSDSDFIGNTLKELSDPRLIIDDGSHHPAHQLIFLDLVCQEISMRRSECIVIIEDIHTSLQRQRRSRNIFTAIKNVAGKLNSGENADEYIYEQLTNQITSLSLILFAERCKKFDISIDLTLDHLLDRLRGDSNIKKRLEQIVSRVFYALLEAQYIGVYQRTTLPLMCWKCSCKEIDPFRLTCMVCGQDCYSQNDSMTALIHFHKKQ